MVTAKCTLLLASLAAAALLTAAPAAAQEAKDSQSAEEADDTGADGSYDEPNEGTAQDAPDSNKSSSGAAISDDAAEPRIHHSPVSSARVDEPLRIDVRIDQRHLVKDAHVIYYAKGKWLAVRLLRSSSGDYTAEIPKEDVTIAGLGYAIEMQKLDGTREAVFGSRTDLHPVIVRDDPTDVKERWLLSRLEGRRSLVTATGELVRFGTSVGRTALPCAADQTDCALGESKIPSVDDQYWRVEASYTYRPLRTVNEFGFRLGVVRGRSIVDVAEYDDEKFDVGLNYAGANVRFRIVDIFHTDLQVMGSVTEIGFSVGAGAAIVLGDPLAFNFKLGWETIGFTPDTYFGTRFYSRLELPVTSRITLAPNIEVSDMPHADRFGVRLLADAGFVLGKGFSLWLRGGYQARVSNSGGPAAGATVKFGF